MEFIVNNTTVDIPFDLDSITLGRFIDYYDQYGRSLDEQLKAISERDFSGLDDPDLERQYHVDRHLDNEAICWYSYWSGFDLSVAKNHPAIEALLLQYRVLRMLLLQSESEAVQATGDVEWNGELWCIQDFKINPASEMSFNEIITSKEVTRQVQSLGKSKWEALPYLCSIYFRRKDEAFTDELIIEDGERMQLMHTLPMSYALRVAFFLTICVHIWRNTSASSDELPEEMLNLN